MIKISLFELYFFLCASKGSRLLGVINVYSRFCRGLSAPNPCEFDIGGGMVHL